MKFGICVDWRTPGRIADAKAAGADYVELSFNSFENANENEILALKAELDRLEIPVLSYNCMIPGGYRVTGQDRDLAKVKDYLERMLAKTAIFGCRHVVFGSAAARRIKDGSSAAMANKDVVEFLCDVVAPAFAEAGWTCSIEPLSECNFLRTTADALTIAKKVDRPEIRVLADFYHVWKVEEPEHSVLACRDWLRHVHVAALKGRLYPTEQDPDDYVGMFRDLIAIGYDGTVSLEGETRDGAYLPQAKTALCVLRSTYQTAILKK